MTYIIGFAPPSFIIAKTASAQVFLQWPTNQFGFIVQSAGTLGTPSRWIPNAVTINGTNYTVSVNTTNAARFFRMRKP